MTDENTQYTIGRRVLIGTGWLTGWRMISRLLGFVSLLVLTQILFPADFGLVALASSIIASVDAMSQLGVRDALIRLRDDTAEHYNTAFTFQAARGLLTGLILAGFSPFANDWLGDARLQPILLIFAALAVVSGCENIGTVRLSRNLDFRTQVLLQAAPRLLGFTLTLVTALLLRSYWALIIGVIFSKILAVGLTYATAPHRPRFSLHGWRYLLHFSLWSWGGSIAVVVWSRSDPFLLSPGLGTSLLGLYVISCEIAILPVTELIEPMCGALFPGFAMAHRTGELPLGTALKVAGSLALCAIPFSIGVSACSGYLVAALLGANWTAAQPLVAIGSWLCMFSPFSYVCGNVLSAQGHVRRTFYCNALAAACKIAAVVATLHYTHSLQIILGVNVAVVGVESLLFIWQARTVGNHGLRKLALTMIRAGAAAAVTCAVLFLLPGTWTMTALGRGLALVAGGLVGVCTFTVFFVSQAVFWHVSGRPDGAEQAISDLIDKFRHQLPAWAKLGR